MTNMRTVIFRDRHGNRIPPCKFYELIPRIKELNKHCFFTFSYTGGLCDRIEFYDDNGIIAGEIIVLNKGVD